MTEANERLLKVLTFGAGALGTYIGGSLALHGHDVVFLETPAVADTLRTNGLHLKLKEKDHSISNPQVASSLDEVLSAGPFDVVIFAIKSFDTSSAAQNLAPYSDLFSAIISFQNGVDKEAVLASFIPQEKVIAGTVTSAIGRLAAGDIVLQRKRGIGIAGNHPLAGDLVDVFNAAGLNARLYRFAADMKWSKMVTNLIANATAAILNMTPAEIFEHPGLFRLEVYQLREALKVMEAQEIQTVDLPGTPVRALSFAIRTLPMTLSRSLLKNAVGSGRGGKMPSFHIDLYNGRGKTEVNYLNGAVVRHGEQAGVDTPVNRLLTETLLALTNGELPLATFDRQPEKLLSAFKEMITPG